MKTLFFFEMKKIWQNKLVWAGLALLLLLSCGGLSSFLAVNVPFGRKLAARYEGPLTDETVARMLADGQSYQQTIAETGASSATISRVKRCLDYGAGGYKTVLDRLRETES